MVRKQDKILTEASLIQVNQASPIQSLSEGLWLTSG